MLRKTKHKHTLRTLYAVDQTAPPKLHCLHRWPEQTITPDTHSSLLSLLCYSRFESAETAALMCIYIALDFSNGTKRHARLSCPGFSSGQEVVLPVSQVRNAAVEMISFLNSLMPLKAFNRVNPAQQHHHQLYARNPKFYLCHKLNVFNTRTPIHTTLPLCTEKSCPAHLNQQPMCLR